MTRFLQIASTCLALSALGCGGSDPGRESEDDDVRGAARDAAADGGGAAAEAGASEDSTRRDAESDDDGDGLGDDDAGKAGPDRDGGAGSDASTQPAKDAGGAPPARGGFYQLERLDRGLVAVATEAGVYLGWRLLGDEYASARPPLFRVLRDGELLAEVTDSTNYLDARGQLGADYRVVPVVDGVAGESSARALESERGGFLRVPLEPPSGGTTPSSCENGNERFTYSPNDASTGDLDGDGQYELVLKWDPSNSKDNSQSGCTGPVYLDAYQLDGTRLWRIDLGPNIRAGAHYTQFVVIDLDGDGRAEVSLKTAPGTRDGTGAHLRRGPAARDDDAEIFRSPAGYVLSGPEYLTVFEGSTGKELATVDYVPGRGRVAAWGDDYGNRVDRFLAGAAFLDDSGLPSVVMARGYYTRSALTAWNYREGELRELWRFDSDVTPRDASGNRFSGQGAHSLSIANVDDDPQQEIIYGAMTLDHDGRGLCSTGFGHGDALHVGDWVPSRPGLEVFMPHEDKTQPSYHLRDGATCEVLVKGPVTGRDTGRGVAADISVESPGAELWVSGTGLLDARGRSVGGAPASANFLVYWDGDPQRELLDSTGVQKYGGGSLLSCGECSANNGTKSNPALVADLFGDHREEIIWRESSGAALRIYTTTAMSRARMYTLMHDAQYRVAIAFQNVGYNQPAHLSFALGEDEPPRPSLR